MVGASPLSTSRSFLLEPSKTLGKGDEASTKLAINYSGGRWPVHVHSGASSRAGSSTHHPHGCHSGVRGRNHTHLIESRRTKGLKIKLLSPEGSHSLLLGTQNVRPPWKTVGLFRTKLHIGLARDPGAVRPGTQPREPRARVRSGACTHAGAAPFTAPAGRGPEPPGGSELTEVPSELVSEDRVRAGQATAAAWGHRRLSPPALAILTLRVVSSQSKALLPRGQCPVWA